MHPKVNNCFLKFKKNFMTTITLEKHEFIITLGEDFDSLKAYNGEQPCAITLKDPHRGNGDNQQYEFLKQIICGIVSIATAAVIKKLN